MDERGIETEAAEMRKIVFNSQRDNKVVNTLTGSVQCFATSAWMFLSFYRPDKYKADDDAGLAAFVAEVTKRSKDDEFEWKAQADMIEKYLGDTVFLGINLNTGDGIVTLEDLRERLKSGPVIIGTKKMGGLPGGHIILAVDNTPDGKFYCNDPYGDANTGYKDKNGENVIYHAAMFDKEHPGALIRAIYK